MDQVQIYNRIVDATGMAPLAAGGALADPVLHYDFNGVSGCPVPSDDDTAFGPTFFDFDGVISSVDSSRTDD